MYAYHTGADGANSAFVGPFHLPVGQPDGTTIVVEPPDLAAFRKLRRLIFVNGLADERQVLDTMWQLRVRLREARVSSRLIEAARARLRLGDRSNSELTWPERLAWLESMEDLLQHH